MKLAPMSPQQRVQAEARLLALTIRDMGGRARSGDIAERLEADVVAVYRRLNRSGPAHKAGLPQWMFFTFDIETREWGLTLAGRQLAEGDGPTLALPPPRRIPDRPAATITCPGCRRTRTVHQYYARRIAREGRSPVCPECMGKRHAKHYAEEVATRPRDPRRWPEVPSADGPLISPWEPTRARPGSEAKVTVLELRFESLRQSGRLDRSLFHPEDLGSERGYRAILAFAELTAEDKDAVA